MYTASEFGASSSFWMSWRTLRTRLFVESGHTFDELDSLSMEDLGDVSSYLSVKSKIEAKRARESRKRKPSRGGSRGSRR